MELKIYTVISTAAAALVVSGCAGNASSICDIEEAKAEISKDAKNGYALFEDIRFATEDPPYKNDEEWIRQNTVIEGMIKNSEDLSVKIDTSVETCIQMGDESGGPGDWQNSGRTKADGGDIIGGVGAFMDGLIVTLVKASVDQLTPAEKRRKIWAPMCRDNDFTPLHEDYSYGTKIAKMLFPARYNFWYNNVFKFKEQKSRLDQNISEAQSAIFDYENNRYNSDFEKVEYDLAEVSLISKNEDETSFSCSANLMARIKDYSEVGKNINYNVLITSEGGKKVKIIEDDDYNMLFSNNSEYD